MEYEEGIDGLDEFAEPGEELDDDELVTHGFGDELGDFDDDELEDPYE
jgi:hypothetical protein